MGRLMDTEAEAPRRKFSRSLPNSPKQSARRRASAVFGSPVVDGKRTVIPVAQARFALGGGDSPIAKGSGGAMTARPLGFIIIDEMGVRFQRTPQPSLVHVALGVVVGFAIAIRLMRPRRGRPLG